MYFSSHVIRRCYVRVLLGAITFHSDEFQTASEFDLVFIVQARQMIINII